MSNACDTDCEVMLNVKLPDRLEVTVVIRSPEFGYSLIDTSTFVVDCRLFASSSSLLQDTVINKIDTRQSPNLNELVIKDFIIRMFCGLFKSFL